MLLTVKLFATFRRGRCDEAQLDLSEGTTIGDVVDGLGIPRDEVGILLVSGRHAQLGDRLSAGDTVSIFPLVGGGQSLVIAVGSPHREAAFEASRYVLEQLETRSPVWKQEHHADGGSEWLRGHPLRASAPVA